MKSVLRPRNLTLGAVAVLLFLVSVPRVHQLAVQDNERDAMTSVLLLVSQVFSGEVHGAPPHLPPTDTFSDELQIRLVDIRYDAEAKLLHRHGYLFDVTRNSQGHDIIRAWPKVHGQTGVRAYLYEPSRGLLGHPNSKAEWSGDSSPRPDGAEPGWAPLPPSN